MGGTTEPTAGASGAGMAGGGATASAPGPAGPGWPAGMAAYGFGGKTPSMPCDNEQASQKHVGETIQLYS